MEKVCSNCKYGQYMIVHSFWDCSYVKEFFKEPQILITEECLTWTEKSE